MTETVLFTGKTHTTSGRDGFARSSDGSIDVKLPNPHPAAEKLFAAAWSACFIGAIELAASRKKVRLPVHPSIDAEIDLITADDAFFLRARLNVSVPEVDRDVAQEFVDDAHGICPYSKATRATSTSRSRSSKSPQGEQARAAFATPLPVLGRDRSNV